MELVACSEDDFSDAELRTEAKGQQSEDVVVLRAADGGEEQALVILSLPTGMSEAELEKLYVPVALRGRGIASRVLQCAEDYCRTRERTLLTLWATPLDDDTKQDWLIGWYKRRGYVDAEAGYAELKKTL